MTAPVPPPSKVVRRQAAERLEALAIPAGALGHLGGLGVWISSTQGICPPRPVENVRAVLFAGDHGIASYGVSAYPREVTAAMVRMAVSEQAAVAVLSRQHGIHLRVLDIAVDDELHDVPSDVAKFKVRRSSGAIHREDALTRDDVHAAIDAGCAVAAEEIGVGAQLLIGGDLGIGNTTPAAALIALYLGLSASDVTGSGTGVTGEALIRKRQFIAQALSRTRECSGDPVAALAAVGSADIAATAGLLATAARSGVPVLLDGLVSLAAALSADRLAPGASAWFAAGHRSTEPAQSLALDKLGIRPVLDLGMRLGEGSGAVAAVPLVRSAAALLSDTGLLADVVG